MIRHRSVFSSFIILFLTGLNACTVQEPLRSEPFEDGVIVLQAGQSQQGNASVSFIAMNGKLTDRVFASTNQRNLGDLLRAYTEIDGKGYLLVSNSDKIEIVENSTFRGIALIDRGVEQCRYMVAAPTQNGSLLKGYVSYWGGKTQAPGIAIVSLVDRKVVGYIPVGSRPEQMAVVGEQLFVATSGDNTVSVINTVTDQLVGTIPVGDVPRELVYDPKGGLLHVLCVGKPTSANAGSTTTAELVRINPLSRQVTSRLILGGRPVGGNPSNLAFHAASQTLYFLLKGAVYASPVAATSVPVDKPLVNQSFTGLGVDPPTGIIYGGYARDSTNKGIVRRFQPTGTRIDSISVDSAPTGFYFK